MSEVIDMTAVATIAAAYLSRNTCDVSSIPTLLQAIRTGLTVEATPAVAPVEELKPAVPVRKSVSPDFLICLEDGKKFKSLKRHLQSHYQMTPDDYRAKWGLPADYPMVAPNYSATRSQLAKDNGLGKKAA